MHVSVILNCCLFFIKVNKPFELIGMEIIGKVAPTTSGNQYICVLVDYFTKWSEAYPIPAKTDENVMNCILKFYYRFGAPKRILTNLGQEFVNQVYKKLYLFKWSFKSAYKMVLL